MEYTHRASGKGGKQLFAGMQLTQIRLRTGSQCKLSRENKGKGRSRKVKKKNARQIKLRHE